MRESSPHACTFYIRTQILPQFVQYLRVYTHAYLHIYVEIYQMQNQKYTRHIKSRRHRRRCPVLLYMYTTRVHHTSTFIIIMQHLWLSNAKQLSDFWSCVQMSLCIIWEAMRRPAAGGGIDTYTYILYVYMCFVFVCILYTSYMYTTNYIFLL